MYQNNESEPYTVNDIGNIYYRHITYNNDVCDGLDRLVIEIKLKLEECERL